MVEESALVLRVESDMVWVQAIQKTACGSCQAQKGCGHSLLAKVGQKQIDIPVARNGLDVQPNEQVIIGVPEQAILRSSMLMYGVPLLSMIFVALLGTSFGVNEGGIITMSFAALIFGFLWVNFKSKTLDFDQWNPQLVRKINSDKMHIPMCEVE
jgi:sigma-E factor negative regulatory protein RseC